MNQFMKNTKHSFHLVKSDIEVLKKEISRINKTQEKIMEILSQMRTNELEMYKNVNRLSKDVKTGTKTKVITKKVKVARKIVGSKRGIKYHISECPFAKNIKSKGEMLFESEAEAKKMGYKPCSCVKN